MEAEAASALFCFEKRFSKPLALEGGIYSKAVSKEFVVFFFLLNLKYVWMKPRPRLNIHKRFRVDGRFSSSVLNSLRMKLYVETNLSQ